jgi:Ca-activated chloride channel family protein
MEFIWPTMLVLLLALPLAVVVYLQTERRRMRALAQYGDLGFAQKEGTPIPALRRHIPPLFFLASLMIVIVSLARPQTVIDVPRLQGTILLAFDVSGSMAADDLQPTRMEAAKAAARDFVARQPDSMLIGVVAFSDSGFAVQVPTNDQALIAAAIGRLAPERGTSLGNGILASLQVLSAQSADDAPRYYTNLTPAPTPTPTPVPQGVYTPAVIILLTDGENTASPNPLAVARVAAEQGVRIYTVGIGSASGADLNIEGFIIHTQLDEAMLQQISEITGGSYYNAENEQDLYRVYDELRPQLITRSEKTEVTAVLAGAGIFVMLIGTALSISWFNRPL